MEIRFLYLIIYSNSDTYTLGLYSMECMHIPRESRARQNFFFHRPCNVKIKFIYFTPYINNGITFVPGQKDHEHAIIPVSIMSNCCENKSFFIFM